EHLDRTEGVHRGYYRRLQVSVVTDDGTSLAAFAYQGNVSVAGRKPSQRYLGLLLDGAREHGLPEEWIRHLEGLELAVDERLVPPGRQRPAGRPASPRAPQRR